MVNKLSLISTVLFCANVVSAEQTGPPRHVLCVDDSKRHIALVDAEGKVEWEYPVGAGHCMQVLDNGNLLIQPDWSRVVEVTFDKEKKIVWEYDARKQPENKGKNLEIHAFQRLKNGNTMIAESGTTRLIEVGADGTIKKQFPLKVATSNAHRDTRQAIALDNGHYLMAHEADGCVKEYDEKGEVVWEYKIPLFDRKPAGGHGPEGFGNSVYGVSRLANGNTLIGTGNGHSVLEVTPKGEVVWKLEQNDIPGVQLAWVCGVERLANGNTRLVNCHAGPNNPQMIEVDKDKKVVWSMRDFVNFGNSMPVGQVYEKK